MQWEIDVFGKVRKDVEMQQASYRASRADYASVSISVCAQIASSYIKLRTLQRQLEVTLDHVEEQRKVMKITEARFDTGLASMLDVSQARTVYYSTLASLSSLRTSVAVTVNALAVLTLLDARRDGREAEPRPHCLRPICSCQRACRPICYVGVLTWWPPKSSLR